MEVFEYSNIHYLLNYLNPEKYKNSFVNMTLNTLNGQDPKIELISNILGVFRQDQKIRQESWSFLINEKVIEWLFDTQKEFNSAFGKVKDEYYITDPFKEFMNDKLTEITYKSQIFPEINNQTQFMKKKMTFEDPQGMNDL